MSELGKMLEGVKMELLALSEVANFRRGSFPQPYGNSEWYDGIGAMPFVQVNDVAKNMQLVSDTKNKISKLAQPKSVFVPKNTVIVTLQGSIGRVAITQYDAYVDRTLAIFGDYKIEICNKYFAYQLSEKFNIEKETARGSTIKTITKEEFSKFKIPIPCPDNPEKSLKIQEEIVRILDSLSEETNQLTAALQKELQIHQKQYNFYREQLFKFEGKEVEWKNMGEAFDLKRGKRLIKSELETEGQFAVYQNSMTPLGYYHKSNVSADTTFLICAGSAGEIGYSKNDFWAADDVYYFEAPGSLQSKFLYYLLQNHQQYLLSKVRRSSVPRLSKDSFIKISIPTPNLQEQERIVKILDDLDAKTQAITSAIKKEIALRNKQFEYYRDRLLSFQSLETISSPSLRAEGEAIQKKDTTQ